MASFDIPADIVISESVRHLRSALIIGFRVFKSIQQIIDSGMRRATHMEKGRERKFWPVEKRVFSKIKTIQVTHWVRRRLEDSYIVPSTRSMLNITMNALIKQSKMCLRSAKAAAAAMMVVVITSRQGWFEVIWMEFPTPPPPLFHRDKSLLFTRQAHYRLH